MEKPATNLKDMDPYLLIAAAGSGERSGLAIPKQYKHIEGKTVLEHTIEAFLSLIKPENIRVIINAEHIELYNQATKDYDLTPPVFGGKTRKDSIYNGLISFSNILDKEIILIHDAARPFIKQIDIINLLNIMNIHEAATLATPLVDTIRTSQKGLVDKTLDRDGLWAIQTPQAFKFNTLLQAHKNSDAKKNYTDDTSIVSDQAIEVKLVEGSKQNFKITTNEDIAFAKLLINSKKSTESRTATGYDVHRLIKGDQITLGGVKIPHNLTLKGHSDADVALHAITDALLGTIAAGDIGEHFPPSNKEWKDANSSVFLKKAVNLIHQKNASISLIDLTIICEEPKIGPHKEKMKNHIASICDIELNQISIKATTTEGLGFTGRKEGIAAQAVATIKYPIEIASENITKTKKLAA